MSAGAFTATSRYATVPTHVWTGPDGVEIAYVGRRLVPHPETLAATDTYVVREGDRPDLIAARALGDPEVSWQLCDANRAMDPDELTQATGRRLRVTMPTGFPAPGGLIGG
jgi:hypothetical protein